MNGVIRWLVKEGDKPIRIELIGITPGGANVSINGVVAVYPLSSTQSNGYYTVLPAGNLEYVLKMDQNGQNIDLQVEGMIQPVLTTTNPAVPLTDKWEKAVKTGRRDLMAVIILTVFNLTIYLLGARIAFPFYIFSAYASAVRGQQFSMIYSNSLYQIAGLIIAFAMVACFLLLYFKAKRFVWPAWVAFSLVIADTLIFLLFEFLANLTVQEAFYNTLPFIFNLATHIWMISDMAKMAQAQDKLTKLAKAES